MLALENLESRDCAAVVSLGQYGYISYPDNAMLSSNNSAHWRIVANSPVIIYTPSYAHRVELVGSYGNFFFTGHQVEVISPTIYFYCTGGNASLKGTSQNESVVQVSQSYIVMKGTNSFAALSGLDCVKVDGMGGSDKYDLYGSSWNEFVSWKVGIGEIRHRDGVDFFYNFETVVLRGGGGADLFNGTLPGGSAKFSFYTDFQLRAMSIRNLVQLSVPITADFGTAAVIQLRNYVNQNISIGSNSSGWLSLSTKEKFYSVFVNRSENVICGGMSILLHDLFLEFGFSNSVVRKVYLWDSSAENSHVSNEVFVDGKWEAHDSTYNISIQDDVGNKLGYESMRNNSWEFSHDSLLGRWRFNPYIYPIPYINYLAFISYTDPKKPQV